MINIALVVVSTILLFYFFIRLSKWWNKYKAWQIDVDEAFQNKDTSSSAPRFAQDLQISDYIIRNIHDKSEVNLRSLVTIDSVFVMMDRNCVYCNINFEEFFNLNKEKKVFVLFKNEDYDKAEELADLYDNSFEVYLADKELFKEMQIRFMPAFIKLGSGLKLEKATPIPLQVINSF